MSEIVNDQKDNINFSITRLLLSFIWVIEYIFAWTIPASICFFILQKITNINLINFDNISNRSSLIIICLFLTLSGIIIEQIGNLIIRLITVVTKFEEIAINKLYDQLAYEIIYIIGPPSGPQFNEIYKEMNEDTKNEFWKKHIDNIREQTLSRLKKEHAIGKNTLPDIILFNPKLVGGVYEQLNSQKIIINFLISCFGGIFVLLVSILFIKTKINIFTFAYFFNIVNPVIYQNNRYVQYLFSSFQQKSNIYWTKNQSQIN